MLRDIKCSFLKPRLVGLSASVSGGVVTPIAGKGSASYSSGATGQIVQTFAHSFARRGISVATAGSDAGQGSWIGETNNVYPTALGITTLSKNFAGSLAAGTHHCLHLGFDSLETSRFKRTANVVRGEFDSGVLHAFQYNSTTPTITIGGRHATITKTGTGDVTLTFRNSAMSAATTCVVCAIPVSTTNLVANISTVSGNAVRILTFSNASTAADAVVNVLVYMDRQGSSERVASGRIQSTQRKPILFGYSVIYASGAPTIDLGSTDVTIAAPGTGRVTFTFAQAFQRAPIMIAKPINNTTTRFCTVDNVSASAFEVRNFNSGGTAATPTNGAGFQVIGLGFDDSTEY